MNKKVIIIAAFLILLLIGGYFLMKKGPASISTPAVTATQEQPTAASSLRDLIAKGISQSCTYSTDNSQGTIYMSGGKIRGDFNITDTQTPGKTIASHMIIMNNTNYLWTEGSKNGIKMSFDQNATPAPVTANTPTNTFDANALNNYKCSAWVADDSLFVLPTGVQFMTFAAPVPGASPATGSASSQCSYCDNLTGDNKTQCLAALKCN